MCKTVMPWSKIQIAAIAALSAAMSGCGGGGGGGDDNPPTPTLIDITAANRDDVAHFTAAGLMALPTTGGSFGMIPLAAGRTKAAGWSVAPMSMLLLSLRAQGVAASGNRRQALAVSNTSYPCDFGGSVAESFDDRDGSGTISVGDVETMVYTNCMISADETMNGTARLTVNQIGTASASFQMDLASYADSTPQHSLTVNGSVMLGLSTPSSTIMQTTLTTSGPVVVAVNTHLAFSDTVTLQNGFAMVESYDSQAGQSSSTFAGRLHSVLAGGMVDANTVAGAPMTLNAADDYPSAGAVRIKGGTGTLMLNAVSSASVRLDLDTDDDGVIESSTTQSWDWLI